MKRILFLLLIGLLVFSFGALANGEPGCGDPCEDYWEHAYDDGEYILFYWDDGFYINPCIEHGEYYPDVNGANQSVSVEVDAEAYIPCVLSMDVMGNGDWFWGISYGPDAHTDFSEIEVNHTLLFDNEIGGFVDEDWNVLGHGRNAEIHPGTGYMNYGRYIQGCDYYEVWVWSNDDCRYQVEAAPLQPVDNTGNSLDLQMRSSFDLTNWFGFWSFMNDGSVNIVAENIYHNTWYRVFHQFRVPYNLDTTHGHYGGTVTFKALTI